MEPSSNVTNLLACVIRLDIIVSCGAVEWIECLLSFGSLRIGDVQNIQALVSLRHTNHPTQNGCVRATLAYHTWKIDILHTYFMQVCRRDYCHVLWILASATRTAEPGNSSDRA